MAGPYKGNLKAQGVLILPRGTGKLYPFAPAAHSLLSGHMHLVLICGSVMRPSFLLLSSKIEENCCGANDPKATCLYPAARSKRPQNAQQTGQLVTDCHWQVSNGI